MNDKLKPCPFCGGEASICKKYGSIFVRCNKCFASSGPFYSNLMYRVEDKAADLWNRRANCPECIKED